MVDTFKNVRAASAAGVVYELHIASVYAKPSNVISPMLEVLDLSFTEVTL